jgi:DNA-binding beta-propeller fold protein YncE
VSATKRTRSLHFTGAMLIGAVAFLPAGGGPLSAATTTPVFVTDRAITPPEGHGVTLAIGTGDNLYVLLADCACVQKFDANLAPLAFNGAGKGVGTGIAVYRGGVGNTNPLNDKVIVADRLNDHINVLDAFGNLIFQFGTTGDSKGQFHGTITAIDVDQVTGKIYVLDGLGYARVQKFDLNGNFERMWGWGVKTGAPQFELCLATDAVCFPGLTGSGPGQLNLFQSVGGIATDGTNVYVSNSENFRIDKFDANGSYLATWGSAGPGDGQCADILGCLGIRHSNGLLYVADSHPNHRIQIFNTSGVFHGKWGDNSVFLQPEDIVIASTGAEFVSDFFPAGFGRLSKWTAADNRHPTNKDQCKNGGYAADVDENGVPFRNQGQCVSYVNHH